MRFYASFFLLFFSLTSFASASTIVAKINNKIITDIQLANRYRFVVKASKISIKSEEEKKILSNQILDKMIDEELIFQEAANLKLEASQSEIRDALELAALQQKKNPQQLKFFFVNNDLSFEDYLRQLESEILWMKITSETLRSKVKVSESEIREFFEQQKFNVNFRQFLIAEVVISQSGNSAQFAKKLVDELRSGADFKTIVKQFSSALSAENNGEIGWVWQGEVDDKIFKAISIIPKGGYSDAVLLADGYHIFKLLDSRVESKIADRDLDSARNAIFNRKLQIVAKGRLSELRKKAFVEIGSS